ncbi:hypothetical protein ABI214_25025 [Prescottella soli]|uniref:Uncharacterized protein n=1 Tax=Prescottella soli TaxID=1543852 RepID=A0ABW9FTN3_9NOCA
MSYVHARPIHVVLARPEPAPSAALERYELMERIDPDHIYSGLGVAITAFAGTSRTPESPLQPTP